MTLKDSEIASKQKSPAKKMKLDGIAKPKNAVIA